MSLGLLVFALISRNQAISARNTARSQALAAESETQTAVDPERAILLAVAALRTKMSYAGGPMFALRGAMDASPIRYRLPDAGTQGCGGPRWSYDPAPPQQRLLAEGLCSGAIRLADATTGSITRTIRGRRIRTDGAGLLGRGLRPRASP